MEYSNGTKTTYSYDAKTFRLTRLNTSDSNNVALQDLNYWYDAVGNITWKKDNCVPTQYYKNTMVTGDNKYTYDALYRLITATGRENDAAVNFTSADNTDDSPFILKHGANDAMNMQNYTQNYVYDKVGNILVLQHSAAQGSYTRNYTYNNGNNRLLTTQIGSNTPYTYNHHAQHGYLTSLPHLTVLNWNFKEEVVATSKQTVNSGTPETTYYQYDSKGKRLRKVTENASTSSTFTKKDSRVYIEGYEFYENFSGTAYVTHSLSLIDGGQRFLMIESTTNPALAGYLVRYQHPNHHSSSTLETDDSGAVISYEEFHPFGTTSYQAMEKPVRAAAKRYRYTGMERDDETGLSYHNARYYISWLGRWLSTDPIGIGDGVNVYAYCHNNPVVLKDESGNGPGDNPYLINKSNYTRQDNTKLPTNISLKKFIKATEDASKANEKKIVLNNPTSNKLYVAPGHEPPAFLKNKVSKPIQQASPTATRIEGAFQLVGGIVEAMVGGVGGVVTAQTGIGAIAGWAVLTHGADNMTTGFNKLVTGQQSQTFTEQVISETVQSVGLDRTTSNKIGAFSNNLIGIAGSSRNFVNQVDALVLNSTRNLLSSEVLMSYEFHGIKAVRIKEGVNGKVAIVGQSMGDFAKRGEYGVVDYARALRAEGYETELFAGSRISEDARRQLTKMTEELGRDLTPIELETTIAYKENMEWAKRINEEGYTVIDIGNPNNKPYSHFYNGECVNIFGK